MRIVPTPLALMTFVVCAVACTGDNPANDPDGDLPCVNADGPDGRYTFERNTDSKNILFWSRSATFCIPIYESTAGTDQTTTETLALQEAIAKWNEAIAECGEVPVCLSYNGPLSDAEGFGLDMDEPYKNLVTYVPDRAVWRERHPDLPGAPPVGLTTLWSTPNGEVFDADIEINTAFYTFSTQPSDTEMDLQSVLVHELGHVLGFDHVEAAGSVMQTSLNPGARRRRPGTGDKEGLCAAFRCY